MEEFVRERIGQTIGGRWTLQSVLGVGGMAAVYAAVDASGAEVAVKILHPEIGRRHEVRERFMREGTVASRIQHPGAVRVLEHGAVDELSVFLVMERLKGESLGERVAREGSLMLPDLLDVLDQVLDVLVVAHGAGIVHRDLKPDNLFLTDDGQVKVLDFGVARLLDATPDDVKTRTGIAMGTLPYMAPEQALGKRAEIDGRVDIFALGATAFRILAKRRVHEADSEAGLLLAMASKPAPPLRSVVEHVPENVAAIIDVALAFSRDARYPDARTMQEDVRAVQRAETPPFAGARLRARDEATRVTSPARPAPAPAHPPTIVQPSPAPAPAPVLDAPKSVAAAEPLPPKRVSPVLLAVGAVGCLLLGSLLWAVWPSSTPAPEAEAVAEVEAEAEAEASEGAESDLKEGERRAPRELRGPARELHKKHKEASREERKKMQELLRDQAKKAGELRKEREKRDKH